MKKIDILDLFKMPIAHRGFHHDRIEENTLQAFQLAIEKGYGIELDIRLTVDGKIVVYHDHDLNRLNGKNVLIHEQTLQQLQSIPFLVSQQVIPSLEDVFQLVQGRVPLLIELKYDERFTTPLADALINVLKTYRYPKTIALQSFNAHAVRYLTQKRKVSFPVGQLASHRIGQPDSFLNQLYTKLWIRHWSKPDFIAYDIESLPLPALVRLRKQGYRVLTWTVNSQEKLLKSKLYADQIIFEKIALSS